MSYKTYEVRVYADGDKFWYLNGELHREDGPAVECADGTKVWYLNGKRHREDGPAIEYANGSKSWYLNGKQHREGGPAVEFPNGTKEWYLNGNLHREGGPAFEFPNGAKFWFLNGKRHRVDGPAVEFPNGTRRWFLNNKVMTEEQHRAAVAALNLESHDKRNHQPKEETMEVLDYKEMSKEQLTQFASHYDSVHTWLINHHNSHSHEEVIAARQTLATILTELNRR